MVLGDCRVVCDGEVGSGAVMMMENGRYGLMIADEVAWFEALDLLSRCTF